MTVNFKLLRPKKAGKLRTEPVSIQIVVCNKGTRVELSTGLKIIPKFWGNGEARVSLIEAEALNDELKQIKKQVETFWKEDRTISGERLNGLVVKAIAGTESQPLQKKTVEPWIQQFIVDSKVKDSTKQVYRSSLTHLINYANKSATNLTWDSFTIDFYEGFTTYLYSIGHNDNTVGKVVKTVKTFLSEAFERNLHTNLSFKKKGFKVISAEVDEIYLSEQELSDYYNVDFPGKEETKKLFVFGCFVGLRFSDLQRLGPNNFIQTLAGPALKVVTQKTGEEVIIALHPIAEEIWQSWKGIPPKQSNPNFNKDIKVIAEKAGINGMVQSRNTIKGRVIVEWVPKYKMVKAHTCRRSYATNSVLRGVPYGTIMATTGHKTERAFKKYVRITKEQHAGIMAEYYKKDQPIMRKAN